MVWVYGCSDLCLLCEYYSIARIEYTWSWFCVNVFDAYHIIYTEGIRENIVLSIIIPFQSLDSLFSVDVLKTIVSKYAPLASDLNYK